MNHCLEHRNSLQRLLPDGLILLTGGTPVARNHDVEYPFRQSSHFLYLTGVEDPNCHLLIDPRRKRQTLFIPQIDAHHRLWLGDVPGIADAKSRYGFSRVLYTQSLPGEIKSARKGYRHCYVDRSSAKRFGPGLKRLNNVSAKLWDALEDLRACKTPGEIALFRRASLVSGRAHREVMRRTRAGMREYQVQAIFESHCLTAGLKHLGYPTIVAAGNNASVLHYFKNDALLRSGDLLLIDAGAEAGGYAADITRTFPVSGRFSPRQREIYSIVLGTQKACIERARAGVNSADLHVYSMSTIAEGLKSLGILKGNVSGLVENGAVRLFYPHGLSHMLGLDVHDVTGGRRRQLPNPTNIPVRFVADLEPGFVLTMEPGIYFIAGLLNDPRLRRKFRGSVDFKAVKAFLGSGGVRIEDDILIRASGPPLNLTHVPKEIPDVEAACRG